MSPGKDFFIFKMRMNKISLSKLSFLALLFLFILHLHWFPSTFDLRYPSLHCSFLFSWPYAGLFISSFLFSKGKLSLFLILAFTPTLSLPPPDCCQCLFIILLALFLFLLGFVSIDLLGKKKITEKKRKKKIRGNCSPDSEAEVSGQGGLGHADTPRWGGGRCFSAFCFHFLIAVGLLSLSSPPKGCATELAL